MPYIDSTPKDYPTVFEEDNFQDVFGDMLTDNGWTLARTFYKAAVDTRAYNRQSERVNYAVAKHKVFRNADGKLLGFAVVANFHLKFSEAYRKPIRRVNDNLNPDDENYGLTPTWDAWVRFNYYRHKTNSSLYFYMLEKLPNSEFVPDGAIVSMVTMPGMSGTSYDYENDRDNYNDYFNNPEPLPDDLRYEGVERTASPTFLTRSVLDVEVLGTEWDEVKKEAVIVDTDTIVMQSPIVQTKLRAEFLEHLESPLLYTNWWTDSEVRIRGYIDSRTIFLTLEADNAPNWESNLVPTIPLYFGKILPAKGQKDDYDNYALFSGTIPGATKPSKGSPNSTYLDQVQLSATSTQLKVKDASVLPDPPSMITVGREIMLLTAKDGNLLTVEREQLDTVAPSFHFRGTNITNMAFDNKDLDKKDRVAYYDFDDPNARAGTYIYPFLKLYPGHPSNGIDSVMVAKSRFGSRYQEHFLSWNTGSNSIPPYRIHEGKKYPRAYTPSENTTDYKYQFNTSRYSGKVHSSKVSVVHPEEGILGYLDHSIAFNPQSVNVSNLRVRKQNCPTTVYEMYKYLSIGAVSPLTKRPSTVYRPMGVGIYEKDVDPALDNYDVNSDATPPIDVTITSVESPRVGTIDIAWELPDDVSVSHVNIMVDGNLYAKGIVGTTNYRVVGLETGFTPLITVVTVDKAGLESGGIDAEPVEVK